MAPDTQSRARPLNLAWRLWAVRVGQVAMWVALTLGVVGGLWALAGPRPQSVSPDPSLPPAAPDVAAGGWAELYVATWLAAGKDGEEALSSFYPGAVDWAGVTAGRRYAARTAAVEIRQVGAGYWSVTVAAEVLHAEEGRGDNAWYRTEGIRFFRVGVLSDDGWFVAAALPAEVPGARPLDPPRTTVPAPARGDLDDPAATATVERFAAALLTEAGDLSRYVAPGASIVAVRPAPYASVTLGGLSSRSVGDGQLLVRAHVVGADTNGEPTGLLEYVLRLALRDGRWEVAELLPAPPLRDLEEARGG